MGSLQEMITRIQAGRGECTVMAILVVPGRDLPGSKTCSVRNCPLCNGSGWIYWRDEERRGYGKRYECGLVERQITEHKLQFASIPEALKDLNPRSFRLGVYQREDSRRIIKDTCATIKYYLDHLDDTRERGIGLYLYSGTKGSGKTRMVASIANELIHVYRIQAKFAGSIQIANEIKATWDDRTRSESDPLRALSTVQVLIIDNFGTELPKDWAGKRFYNIINGRYQDKLITFFTSNMNLPDLCYDDRTINRIRERTLQFPFPEESVREQVAEQNQKAPIKGIKGGARDWSIIRSGIGITVTLNVSGWHLSEI